MIRNLWVIGVVLVMLFSLNSCVNFRYTDYGKPFDFLKSKNTYVKSKNLKNDTAAVFQSPDVASITQVKDSISKVAENSKIDNPIRQVTIDNESITSEDKDSNSAIEGSELTSDSKNSDVGKKPFLTEHQKNVWQSDQRSLSNRPPGWWSDMWHAIWMFFLKWFLIVLAAVVVLALLLWGLYALIALLANPTIAGIVVCVIIAVIWFFIEYS